MQADKLVESGLRHYTVSGRRVHDLNRGQQANPEPAHQLLAADRRRLDGALLHVIKAVDLLGERCEGKRRVIGPGASRTL